VLTLTGSLAAIDRDSPRARTIRDALARTFDGLAVYQDAASGLWRNVIDEPFTRPETSGTCTYLLAHDLLTQMGLALPRHEAMFARAFEGLLPLCYRQGISAFCRGTDYGPAHYYRCRPMGYSPSSSFFIPTVARRAAVTGA
jgi:rhamnogalacturonyl hydrolase YesR